MSPADAPPRRIAAQPLTREGFLPYGDLIAPGTLDGASINAGSAQRYDGLTSLDLSDHGGAACLALFRTQGVAAAEPVLLQVFERHLLGSQTFVPLGAGRCLCVVTSGGDTPDESAICAFVVEPGQGITLRRGVWHHPLITLGPADVLVIERRAAQVDCEIYPISGRIVVVAGSDSDPAGIRRNSNDETR
jgi:ureidoglycolate lyase